MASVPWVIAMVVAAACVGLAGCGSQVTVLGGDGGQSAGTGTEGGDDEGGYPGWPGPVGGTSDKVDLLFVVDNSRSMADKQQVLNLGVGRLLELLANPLCVDADGYPVSDQPLLPSASCPSGSARQHQAVRDMHVGVISSSLGSHGADSCSGATEPSENDRAHLIDRSAEGSPVPTYQGQGFLAWDPTAAKTPAGVSDLGQLSDQLSSMIAGAGEVGCGYEAPLESWYRFLIEPDPYDSVDIEGDSAILQGTDQQLLTQRAEFLRSDSVVMIVILSDENDCSMRAGGRHFLAAQIYQPGSNNPHHLPKPRAACAADPNDPCCRSCMQEPGEGCDTSADDCGTPYALPATDDNINLRCFDQKRRFGIDFLEPMDRYVDALSYAAIADRHGNVVPNPLFAGGKRDPSMVYLSAIVGVPWQDLARRDQFGAPSLSDGLDAGGKAVGGLQSPAELVANGTWDLILGDPAKGIAPLDPLMVESVEPRSGVHPITGHPVAPPQAAPLANAINGHEYDISGRDDLQYSCIFRLDEPLDCSLAQTCQCLDPDTNDPTCQAPDGHYGDTQFFAKAYPGLRHLQLIAAIGQRGLPGSICPHQTHHEASVDFAYRPSHRALVDAASRSLQED